MEAQQKGRFNAAFKRKETASMQDKFLFYIFWSKKQKKEGGAGQIPKSTIC